MHKYETEILDIVKNLFPEISGEIPLQFSPPPKAEFGDIAIWVFWLSKTLGIAPLQIAQRLALALGSYSWAVSATPLGGYVNIFLSNDRLLDLLAPRTPDLGRGKLSIIEPFSANVGKPLHIGHLCPSSVGQALINVHRYFGWKVISDNHLGDWGGLFGKLIVGYQRYGNPVELQKDAVEHLLEVYVAITAAAEADPAIEQECRDAFRELSLGRVDYMELWATFTHLTIAEANKLIARVHVHCDVAVGESFFAGLSLPKIGTHPDLVYSMQSVIEELVELGIASCNEDGSIGVVFSDEAKIPSCILAKRDGATGYLASDLACMKYRMTNGWNPTKIIICTDVRQELHFKQLFWITDTWLELSDWGKSLTTPPEFIHAKNGFIKLKDGAMSTRKGNIIRLADLLDEAVVRIQKVIAEKGTVLASSDAESIGIGAVKYSYLMQDAIRDTVFDWDKALSLEWHSGPYIQYAYVRARKILSKSGTALAPETDWSSFASVQISPLDRALLLELSRLDAVALQVYTTSKPHHLASYAYSLASVFSSFYVGTPGIVEEPDAWLRAFRLALVRETADRLQKSFKLLAIEMPEAM